jgi:hypothetical protein
MKTVTFPTLARLGLFFAFALSWPATPSHALGTCGPTAKPDNNGVCQPCPAITTPASIGKDQLTLIFQALQMQNARYNVSNNVGTFDISNTNLGLIGVPAPAPAPIPLQSTSGTLPTFPQLQYTAYPSVPTLSVNWDPWIGGDRGAIVNARISGEIDVHISADPIVVNPIVTLTNLPATITVGTDSSGFATANVDVSADQSFFSVSGCGAFGWCNGIVSNLVQSYLQQSIRNTLSSQITAALNGPNNSSPFWVGLMNGLANVSLRLPGLPNIPLIDPAGYSLPKVNQATSGGTSTSWTVLGNFGYADGNLTATFQSSIGLCYINCTPRPMSQLCGPNSCGMTDDGCGDTVTCPGVCASGQVCTTDNVCCTPVGCAVGCGIISDQCGGTISCPTTCGAYQQCVGGMCKGTGGQYGRYCQECRNNGGRCNCVANNCLCQGMQ